MVNAWWLRQYADRLDCPSCPPQAGDQRTLMQAANQMALLVAYMGSGASANGQQSADEKAALVAQQSASLITAILSGAAMNDPEQVGTRTSYTTPYHTMPYQAAL